MLLLDEEPMDISNLPANIRLNPFFRIKFGKVIEIELLLDGTTFEVNEVGLISLLAKISGSIKLDVFVDLIMEEMGVDRKESLLFAKNLCEANILVDAMTEDPREKAIAHWVKRGWMNALILHLKTRNLNYSDDRAANPLLHNRKGLALRLKEKGAPEIWKKYTSVYIELPKHQPMPDEPFSSLLLRRRSHRPWQKQSLTLVDLSSILYFAHIETKRLRSQAEDSLLSEPENLLNSSFSSVENYFFAFNIDGLSPGIYHYDPQNHAVAQIKEGDLCPELVTICYGQGRLTGSACAFVLSVIWERYMFRYTHPRAYRSLLTNTAELGHKLILLATALNYNTFLTPALLNDAAGELMGLNAYEEAPLYVIAIG